MFFWCQFITKSNKKTKTKTKKKHNHVQLCIIIYIECTLVLFHEICLTDHCNDKIFNHINKGSI